MSVTATEPAGTTAAEPADPSGAPALNVRRRRTAEMFSFRNMSAIYIFAVLFLIYSLWIPDTFLTVSVWRTLLDSQSINAIVAIGLLLPLAAGVFDLAVGAEVGLGAIFVAWLLAEKGIPVPAAIVLAIAAGGVIGLVSGLLVIKVGIDSFIATLGISSVLAAGITWISGGEQIINLPSGFQTIATQQIFGVTLPVYIMIVLGLIIWYVLERTPLGRRIYATGGNPDAARLAGVRTPAIVLCSLAACGAIAAGAGVLLTARINTGDPTVGPSFLLPAFSAVFLGSTQFRGGRFNVAGTLAAVYVLAVGIKGLQLGGAPTWIPDLFNGLALLVAVGLARFARPAGRASAVRRLLRMRSPRKSTDDATDIDGPTTPATSVPGGDGR
ncbi:ABC transporter permease [Jatrophihabitans fulvus]